MKLGLTIGWCPQKGRHLWPISVSLGSDAHQGVDLWYKASLGFSFNKVLVEESFSPSRVISRQKGSLHLISLNRKSPSSLCSEQIPPCKHVSLPQGTESPLSPMTALYFGMDGQNDSHQPTHCLFSPFPFRWSRGMKGIFVFCGEQRSAKHCWRRLPRGFQGFCQSTSLSISAVV